MNRACSPYTVRHPTAMPQYKLPAKPHMLASCVRDTDKDAHAGAMQGAITPTPSYNGAGCAPGRTCRAPAARTWAAIP